MDHFIKSLSNETRLNILEWLKDPFAHFPKEELSKDTLEFGWALCPKEKEEELQGVFQVPKAFWRTQNQVLKAI